MSREKVSVTQMSTGLLRPDYLQQDIFKLYRSLAVPSYSHAYSICIEYYYNWFASHFAPRYFKGGIYIDGKHVLDEYKQLNLSTVKRENPRARIVPTLDMDYDRDDIDNYLASPDVYLRRSRFQDSFFKDYDRKLFLSLQMRALRMNFNAKVRVNTKAEQLDLWHYMQLNFRNGATQYEYLSMDFHVPKNIILNIAEKAGFEIDKNEIVNIIGFLNYFNQHSDLTLLFKIRAANKMPEFFLRVNDVYTHISSKDKLQVDSGERDGKLDFNFHVEMENIVTMPVPAFFVLSSQDEVKIPIEVKEMDNDMIGLYSINVYEIPPVNEKGWNQAAITSYQADKDETEIDISSLFTGENILTRTINHDLAIGVSPSRFIEVKAFKDLDLHKNVELEMDWNRKVAITKRPLEDSEILQIVIYYDREYISTLDTEINKYNDKRIGNYNQYHDMSKS